MRPIVFELCAETLSACHAARPGGAHRIELCSALGEGGVTPSHSLIHAAIEQSGLPVHVLIRPRSGGFVYSREEIELMRTDVQHAKSLGASGIVFGLLSPNASVDIPATRAMVELAHPMKVTFHRAFDVTASLPAALEDVISTGCDRVLTSGGERDAVAGANVLAKLVKQAAGRIEVAVGGGLRLENAAYLSQTTGATHFHATLRSKITPQLVPLGRTINIAENFGPEFTVAPEDIRTAIQTLQGGSLSSDPTLMI